MGFYQITCNISVQKFQLTLDLAGLYLSSYYLLTYQRQYVLHSHLHWHQHKFVLQLSRKVKIWRFGDFIQNPLITRVLKTVKKIYVGNLAVKKSKHFLVDYPDIIHLIKVENGNMKAMCKTSSKSRIKTL